MLMMTMVYQRGTSQPAKNHDGDDEDDYENDDDYNDDDDNDVDDEDGSPKRDFPTSRETHVSSSCQ